MKSYVLPVTILLCFSAVLFTADDPAKGHYESALFFLKDQKYQQALDDLNFITKSFPQSSYADDALLQLGVYYLEKENQLDQALGYFRQIKDGYTKSNSAPAAYYYIGVISLSRRGPSDLDEAYANFERVTRVFPSSEWVDESLVGAGNALKLKGEFDTAYEEFSKVKVRFADSPLAPRAQFEMGLCSLYSEAFIEAAYNFQQLIDQFPNSDLALPAREMNTLIYRLYVAPVSDKKPYAPDNSYAGTLYELDNPSGIAIDSKGQLYLSDKDKKSVYLFDPAGKIANTTTMIAPRSVSLNDRDHLIVATETGISIDGKTSTFTFQKDGKPQPLLEFLSAAMDSTGQIYVVSEKSRGILVYDQNREQITTSPFTQTEREYQKIVVNSRNQVYAMDRQRKQIIVFGSDGKALFGLGPTGKGYSFDRIEDFAVDRANHIYALVKNPRGVIIFSPSGNLLRFIPSDKKTGTLSFEDAKLIAVGPSGAIFVLDKDQRRIIKIG